MSIQITYRQAGDYQLPNLIIPESERAITLGRYGMLHKKYLKENKKLLYSELMLSGTLMSHCKKIEETAKERLGLLMKQMAKSQEVTQELKSNNQMKWVGMMNNIRNGAEKS